MKTLQELLELELPTYKRSVYGNVPNVFSNWQRFHNQAYIPSPEGLHEEFPMVFLNNRFKWESRGRYSGANINCGHFFASSEEAANAEIRFYQPDLTDQGSSHASVTLRLQPKNILNLTEPSVMKWVFDELICLPIHRRTLWLALLASFKKQGNLITDFVGGWAFHKGYDGVLFLSARALEPLRNKFDSTSKSSEGFAWYWTQAGGEYDYLNFAMLENIVRPKARLYCNLVYFNGHKLLHDTRSFKVLYPCGQIVEGDNKYFGESLEDIQMRFTADYVSESQSKEESLRRLASILDQLRQLWLAVKDARKRYPNQMFGEWVEENLIAGM